MPTLKEIADRRKEVSGQVSTQTRTLALGLLAIGWALLTAKDGEPIKLMATRAGRSPVLTAIFCALATIACDLLQYVAATSVAQDALERAEKSEQKTARYNLNSYTYRFQLLLYRGKFWCLALGSLLMLLVFIRMI